MKKSSLPSRDHSGWAPCPIWCLVPVGGKGSHEGRPCYNPDLSYLIRHPSAVGRKRSVRGQRRALDSAEQCRFSIAQRERPEREILVLLLAEQEAPGRRETTTPPHATFRVRVSSGARRCHLSRLPEQRLIAVAIRLKRQAAAVGGPEWEVVASDEGEPPYAARAGHLVG